MDPKLESKLQEVIDEQEIHDLLMRYCRGVDRGDAELIHSAYHPDAIDDHGDMILNATEIPELFVKLAARSPFGGMHFIGNILIEVDGDTAFAESYFMAIKDIAREDKRFIRIRAAVMSTGWRSAKAVGESSSAYCWMNGTVWMKRGNRLVAPSAMCSAGAADPVFRIKQERIAREPHAATELKLRPL